MNQTEHKVQCIKILPYLFCTSTYKGHCDHPSNCLFHWNSQEQGLILGSFAIGNILTPYLGGFLADRYGGKFVYGSSHFFGCMFNFILPWFTVSSGKYVTNPKTRRIICVNAKLSRFVTYSDDLPCRQLPHSEAFCQKKLMFCQRKP